ncbi:MAG: hypothetical protein QM733_17335 [Ilumatobacteraceae bacterium]
MSPELTVVVPGRSWQMPDAVVALDWSSDGRLLAIAADGAVSVDAGPPIEGQHGHGVALAGFWAGATAHACGYRDGTITLAGCDGLHAIPGDAGPLGAMLWTGAALVTAHRHELVVIGTHPPRPALDLGAGQLRALAALTPSYLVAVGADEIAFVDIGLHLVDARVDLEGGISVAADPHARYVAVGDLAGSIHVLTVGDEAYGRELSGYPDPVRHLACSRAPAGVIAAADDELTFWTVNGGEPGNQPTCAIGHGEPITALAASPAGLLVATADTSGRVCIWHLRDLGGPVWCADGADEITTIAWSTDGTGLAVGDVSGAIAAWAVTPGMIA